MGLDMYVVVVDKDDAVDDFSFKQSKSKKPETLYTWRKHPNLHGWMANLWAKKLKAAGKAAPKARPADTQFIMTNATTGEKFTLSVRDMQTGNLPEGMTISKEQLDQLLNTVSETKSEVDPISSNFNNVYVRLTEADIAELGVAIAAGTLPHTTGFFFGESTGEERDFDLIFISRALAALRDGKHIYYTSWW